MLHNELYFGALFESYITRHSLSAVFAFYYFYSSILHLPLVGNADLILLHK